MPKSSKITLASVGVGEIEKINPAEMGGPREAHEHKRGKAKKSQTAARTPVKRLKDVGPTPERLAKGDLKTASGYRAQGQIERMMEREQLAPADTHQNFAMFRAAEKLEQLFHDAGLSVGVAAQDLTRVVVHGGEASGMAQTERQYHHRQQFRQAVKLLGWYEAYPHRGAGRITVNVVCYGMSVKEAAAIHCPGGSDAMEQCRAMDRLREGLLALAFHWRMLSAPKRD